MALLALMDAFAAKLVIGDTVAVIQEERPFLFSLFAHSWHWLAPFCKVWNEIGCVQRNITLQYSIEVFLSVLYSHIDLLSVFLCGEIDPILAKA